MEQVAYPFSLLTEPTHYVQSTALTMRLQTLCFVIIEQQVPKQILIFLIE